MSTSHSKIAEKREKGLHYVPVQAFVIIFAVEELYLLERVRTRQITTDGRMQRQKRVQCRGARFLRPNDEKPW